MTQNPKFSIVVTFRQSSFLKLEAERLGVTISEVIRQLVDREIQKREQLK